MNKKVIGGVLAVVALLAVGYFAFVYDPCVEPSDVVVATAQLNCTMELFMTDVETLRADFCSYASREANCDIGADDTSLIEEMFIIKLDSCVKSALEADNFCTDKLESIGS